jgi:hypothetical protein
MAATAPRWLDRQAAQHRQSLRARHACCELIRERLQVMGIDPALAAALRRGEEAAAELAAIPDTEELQAADDAIVRAERSNRDDGAHQVGAKITRPAEQYRASQHWPDLPNSSPAVLLTFCVAIEMDAQG